MVREIDHRVFVSRRGVVNLQVLAFERIADDRCQLAGKALITIGTDVGQFDSVRHLFSLPDNLVKSLGPAVKRIRGLDFRDLVGFAVERELATSDAVSVAAYKRPKKRRIGLGAAGIPVDRVEA